MRVQLLLGSLCLIGCGFPESPPSSGSSASERSEIVGGVTDTGDPATVSLVVGQGGQYEQFCTGTLVGPRTVVTAAHCIQAYGAQYSYYVNFGTYASSPTRSIKMASQTAHPLYDKNSGDAHDFGVIQLLTAVTDVTAIELNTVPLTQADVGRPIRHAGFGVTSGAQNGAGTKRQVSYSVRQVTAALIESGASGKQTCNGDSGGPALMVMPGSSLERLVGVVSFGDQNCTMFGEDGRVDVDVAWIKQTMAPWEAPTCATDGKCLPGCTPVDQDCACAGDGVCGVDCADLARDPDCPVNCVANGVCALETCPRPDPDCVVEGSACVNALVCHGRQCVSDEQHGAQKYCSVGCGSGAGCPSVMECNGQVCLLKQRPVIQAGEFCVTATDFCTGANRLCTGPSQGITRCVLSCVLDADCAAGNSCEGGADSRRFCRPPESELRFNNIVLVRATAEGPAAPTGCAAAGFGEFSSLGLLLGGLSLTRRRAPALRLRSEA